MLQLERPRTRQPQWRPQIDWSNPITRGLVFATADGKYDSVTKRILTPLNNPGVRPTRAGLFGAYQSASSQYRTLPFSSSALSEFSFFSLASFDDTSTQRSIITLSELSTVNRLVLFIGQTANRVSLNSVDSSGGAITATGTSAIAAGKIYTLGGTYKFSSGLEVFVNGKLEGTGGNFPVGFSALSTIGLAARYNGSWGSFGNGAYAGQCIWGRKLSAGEFQALDSNPWQIFAPRRFTLGAVAIVQIARPISDISNTGWVPSTGTELHPMIGETVRDDATFIAATAVGALCECGLESIGDPNVSTGHSLPPLVLSAPGGGGITVRLRQGTTTIATWTYHPGATPTEYTPTLSGAEADSITDYTALRLQFEAIA